MKPYDQEPLLSWPFGNDVWLKIWLYKHELQNDEPVRVPYIPDANDILKVWVANDSQGRQLESYRDGEDLNAVIAHVPWDLVHGTYGLGIEVTREQHHMLSFDCGVIGIVYDNEDAKTLLTRVGVRYQANVEVEFQIVHTAITQGKSAYEEWRELPGNESKTLQDFINEVVNLNGITEAALETIENARTAIRDTDAAKDAAVKSARDAHAAAVAAEKVNAVLHGTTLTVTDHDGQSESVDVKGDTGFCFFALFDMDESGDLVMTHNPLDEVVLEVEDGDLYQTYNIQTA